MGEKKALLVVSFGTSHRDTLEKTIAAIENTLAAALPDYTLRRAFTSGMIMRKLAQRDNLHIDDVPTALARLEKEGYTHVLLQPTHVICGEEYDKLVELARPFKARLQLAIGTPLLTEVADFKETAQALMEELTPPGEDEAIVLMGHGTTHNANAAYCQLEYVLHDLGWTRIFAGTVEGYPELPEVIRRLREQPKIKNVRLYPLMVVAGDHAKNDMAGPEEDSWKSILEAEGYTVQCTLRGLGEYAKIRELFARHARRAEG
jgi:sirohydrochlorin cobaltochelatase